ncbi:MAG: glycosyltransferase [Planctomycetes bacterium]|nr:glycosyltransferase [Planctomycetota bacterium]
MRIGFISSYPPIECGIATYTQYLTDAMRDLKLEVYVVAHQGAAGKNVLPTFDYEDPDLAEKAFGTMVRLTPDVVHIQHEFGLFGKHAGVSVVPLIIQFRQVGVPVVTTLHTVYRDIPDDQREILLAITNHSDRLIVHEPYQLESLKRHFGDRVGEKTSVIPHGARLVEPVPAAKRQLELPTGAKVILLIGYFRPSKNFELIVDVFPEILKRCPNAILLVAGKVRGKEHLDYRHMLLRRLAESPARDHIRLVRGQLPQETFDLLLSAADVVALPYKMTSQSGILAHCLAFGKPVVTSSTPAMEQILSRCEAGLLCADASEYVDAIVRVLRDESLARRLSENARQYVRNEISWPRIAERTLQLYHSIVDVPLEKIQVLQLD